MKRKEKWVNLIAGISQWETPNYMQAISKVHLTPNDSVVSFLKMLIPPRGGTVLFHVLHMTPAATRALSLNMIYTFETACGSSHCSKNMEDFPDQDTKNSHRQYDDKYQLISIKSLHDTSILLYPGQMRSEAHEPQVPYTFPR